MSPSGRYRQSRGSAAQKKKAQQAQGGVGVEVVAAEAVVAAAGEVAAAGAAAMEP